MSTRSVSRFVAALAAVAAAVVGLPLLLLVGANQRFGRLSPLDGMNTPWRWSTADLRSWGRRLTKGLGSSAELVDLFFRVALMIGWICAAVLIYTVVAETIFQLRHGMPSAHHRRLGGLGLLGRKLATALVAVLPLAVSASPALAGSPVARPAVTVVADIAEASVVDITVSPAVAAAAAAPLADVVWSQVEVQRGDSVWAIAERIADGRDVDTIATQIVDANLGVVMNDGHRFATPALIEPGWLLNVPVSNVAAGISQPVAFKADVADASLGVPQAEDSHVVQPGDSYWKIADGRLDASASESAVQTYSQALIDINSPVLGYSNPTMLHPGDVVLFAPAAPDTPPANVAVETPAPVVSPPVPPTVVVELPPPVQEPAVAAPTLDPPASLPAPELPVPIDAPATPVVAAAAPDVTVVEQAPDEGIPVKEGLAAAALLSAGAIAVLQARRRQQLRSAQVGARLLQPTDEAVETETLLRSLSVVDRLARVDLALRCAAPELAAQLARVIAVEISEAGEVRLYPDRPATVISPHWIADAESDDGAWRLPADVSLADLADDARRAHQPCPALIHIGESAGGQLFVDLEAVGVLGVQASPETSAAIVRCAAASLAVSPFAESSRIFTFGLEDETQLGSLNVEAHASLGDAIEAVRTTVGSIIPATSGSVTTFALRAAAHGGEAWEPSLLLALGGNAGADDVTGLVALAGGGGRGVGAMIDRPVGNGGMTLRADGNDFVLEPLGRRVTPVGLSAADVAAVDNLLDAADRPLVSDVDESAEAAATPVSVTEFADPAHELVVSVLGQVGVQSTGGEPVGFERSKAQELVVWLSQHGHRPTRAAARTAMWDLAVRDATFSNVVSDARRAMAKVVAPPAGQEWIGRTMSEDLPLHELVVSDAELLAHRVTAARGLDATAAIAVLRPGVERINGMPFAGTAYLWPDAEGTTSSLVLLATSAAAELAAHHLAVDDVDGVFWATGQGLKVLAGHEELIALRMRAHAHRGDLAGVRSEWESYERALNADTWAAAEPSPKLVELRKELLSPSLAS
jgi:LysM domain